SGYGIVNVERAVQIVDKGNFILESVVHQEEKTFDIHVCGNQLQVMLVWSDLEGWQNSANHLINDLDIELERPQGSIYHPLTLNPASPTALATNLANHCDNVEQVWVNAPVEGLWTIRVKGYNIHGSQDFSLTWIGGSLKGKDAYIKDLILDDGNEPDLINDYMWISPDILVRQNQHPNPSALSFDSDHQNARYLDPLLYPNRKNYVYVKIRNKGCNYVNGDVNVFWAKASPSLSWPEPWDGSVTNPLMGGIIGIQPVSSLVPGGSAVLEFEWVPENPANYGSDQNHFCLLAEFDSQEDPMTFPAIPGDLCGYVRNNNNVAWKNITVVDEDKKKCGFLVANYSLSPGTKKLVFNVPESDSLNCIFDIATVKIKLQNSLYQIWEAGGKQGSNFIEWSDSSIQIMETGAYISNLTIGADSIYGISAEFQRDSVPSLPLCEEYYLYVQQEHENSDTIDGGVCFLMNQGFLDPNRYLDLTIFLEGPYTGLEMNTTLNEYGILPLNQPYYVAPWYYPGTESVTSIPSPDIVDWILLELRDATDASMATPETKIAQQAAFLRNDGIVTDISGMPELSFGPLTIANDLFLVIYHRNHLSVISNSRGIIHENGHFIHNFSTGPGQAYGGSSGHKEIGPGVWGMFGGDGDGNGIIDIVDKDPLWEIEAGTQGYMASDYNMDVHSNNMDKDDIWNPNFGSAGQVPGGYGFACGDLLSDPRDGKSYQTVLIGTQCWMAENMNIGTMLISGNNQTDNALFEKYCDNNNTSNCDTYGGLYQWDEAMQYTTTPGVQGICPAGWHLPTDDEWCLLENYVDAGTVSCTETGWRGTDSGLNLKSTSGWYSAGNGSGLYGFMALPGGYSHTNGSFGQLTYHAHFWSSVENGSSAWKRNLYYNSDEVNRTTNPKTYGHSVRCIKD
ncbi:MAG: fibrobacter succinogenes major paralogous domain-containing protein, partial [Bacteroidales bacterium]|nr:fibrobacter succinogenes major paralogous domain-containing protein [Bacteroidales bacterium]